MSSGSGISRKPETEGAPCIRRSPAARPTRYPGSFAVSGVGSEYQVS